MAEATKNRLDIEQILMAAEHRWLRPTEICEILRNYHMFRLAPEPPSSPASGSLFLFDRKVLRYFGQDGHNWKKKKDGKTVKEPHVRIKVGSIDMLDCFIAHGEENENFQRHSYWMLEEELSDIVLVHYLEVKTCGEVSSHLSSQPTDQKLYSDSANDLMSKSHEQEVACDDLLNSPQLPYAHLNMQNDLHVQNSNAERGHLLKLDSECNLIVEGKSGCSSAIKQNLFDGSMEEGLKRVASFSHWLSKEPGDVQGLNMQFSSRANWETVQTENGVHDSSNPAQDHLGSYMPCPSLSQDQLYRIIDIWPNWAYIGSEVKVLITGKFLLSQREAGKCNWSCMFGEVEAPAEIVADGLLCCQTSSQKVGRVPVYVTCSNRLACSEVREFEFRANPVQDVVDTAEYYGDATSETLRIRLGKLLCLSSVITPNCEPSNLSDITQLKNKISSLLKEESDGWDQMLKLTSEEKFSSEDVKEKVLQKLLKEKLHVWLLQKADEGGKGPCVLDKGGQGVLHFAAALGYDWALEPTIVAGVNTNFRDVNGWTALHWAAYCGRERTVAFLIALGADLGALSDPTPECPLGRTPAELASSTGHKAIACYLAESALISHLSASDLFKQDSDVAEIHGAKVVQTVSQQHPTPISDGDLLYGLSLKDSFAAVCNATRGAAYIHQVFQVQSFQKKQLKGYGDDTFGISDEHALSLVAVKSYRPGNHDEPVHAAAIRIQNKFRSWKGRKDFLIIRQQIVKIQAHVRGHQVRKCYKKIVWSVGIVEKVILRWRRKGSGLRGFKSEALPKGSTSMLDTSSKEDDFDFLKEGMKQKEERLQKALAQVKSMVQYPEARDEYRRLLNVVNKIPETKAVVLNNSEEMAVFNDDLMDTDTLLDDDTFMPLKDLDSQSWEDCLEDYGGGVRSQPGILKQGHEILGEVYSNSFGEREEFGSHLPIQGELKGNRTNVDYSKATEGTIPYFQETELTTPNSDVEHSQSSSFHQNSYQVPLQSADTMILSSAQASMYEDAKSDDSLPWKSFWDSVDLDLPMEDSLSFWGVGQGVGSQPFRPSFSSTQPDTVGNVPKQGHAILGEHTNNFGEWKEFVSHLPVQGESQECSNTSCLGMTSTQSGDVASENIMDYSNEFTTFEMFKSKKALSQWVREVGRRSGFVIVVKRSDSGDGGQKARITFCCERSGQYRNTGKNKLEAKEKQLQQTNTKKCGCPFTLKGNKLDSDDNWVVKVVCGVHNHPATEPFEGRSYAGRLSKEETSLLIDMSKSMVRPKDILETLKNRDVNNASTIKQIYNARQRYNKVIEMTESLQMQQLLSKLSEHKYIEQHRSFDNTNIIKDIFWAHPNSIDLLRAFPQVLLMDCTFKTKYNLTLLEILGVTSTNMTFAIAFAYLESKVEDNYVWALERLKNVMDDDALPTVILSDKELALMNAIGRIFPTAKHLLCRWHIDRSVLTNCKKLFAINEIWKKFIMSWNAVVLSSNEDEFNDHLSTLQQEFSSYPQAIEHLTNTWLNNHKERFVSAWTDKIMHFGTLTKNWVESSHAKLRKQLCSSQGNFETTWAKIHSLLELQHANIKASFAKSLAIMQDQFKSTEFKELQGFISVRALHMIFSESKRANSIGVDASTCGCIIRLTHGLPCAHEIAKFKRESRPVPLKSIDSYWRKLDLVPVSNKHKAKLGYDPGVDLIAKRFEETDYDKFLHPQKLRQEIADLQYTSILEPEAKKEIHGGPNSKVVSTRLITHRKENRLSKVKDYTNMMLNSNAFVNFFPVGLQPYIHHIKDVTADGNCGFRVISNAMCLGENGWTQARKDLLNELNSNLEYYSLLYGTNERVEELIQTLSCFESFPKCDRWMTMPDMGHLIASAYNVVLFHLSLLQCLTFLPLRSMPMPISSRKYIAIGFVNNNHFVEVFLSADHPVPPIATNWYKFHQACAKGWDTAYISRIEHFQKIINNDVATNEIIDIDSNLFGSFFEY